VYALLKFIVMALFVFGLIIFFGPIIKTFFSQKFNVFAFLLIGAVIASFFKKRLD